MAGIGKNVNWRAGAIKWVRCYGNWIKTAVDDLAGVVAAMDLEREKIYPTNELGRLVWWLLIVKL